MSPAAPAVASLSCLPFIVSGALLCAGAPDALYWMVPGVIVSLIATVLNAWVLLVEIALRNTFMIAGNWKMNGVAADLAQIEALARAATHCDIRSARPPRSSPAVRHASRHRGHAMRRNPAPSPATSAPRCATPAPPPLSRRLPSAANHAESDVLVAAKARAAWRAGLLAIICIGETEAQRDAGQAYDVCKTQPSPAACRRRHGPANTAIAYEPVWAIGTGKTPTNSEIAQMHAHIKAC